jgi:protein-S-isoprenylcysteine O-methyltransferase Ste14
MNIFDLFVIISLVIFYLLFLGRTVLLYKQGIKVFVAGTSGKNISEKILENLTMPVLVLWTIFVILTIFRFNFQNFIFIFLINIFWLKYIGIIFCYIGLIIFLLALISFGKAWRIGIDEQNSNELITGGVFKYSRNPIFLFMDLYFLGIALIYPNIVLIIIFVGMIIGIHLQIIREEKYLLERFGENYLKYKKQTRRYV